METVVEKKASKAVAYNPKEVTVIPREEIESISTIEVDGKIHSLGEHRDFRRNPVLKQFLPEKERLSLSWTRLKDKEELKTHEHPTASMILVCKGSGKLTGQKSADLKEGDVVVIPPHCLHGFIGTAKDGMDCLSVQFGEQGGLYEDTDNALVEFKNASERFTLDDLLAHNRARLEGLKNNRFYTMLVDGTLDDPKKRQAYLNNLEIWTIRNQLLLFTRQSTCVDEKYEATFLQHFNEEIGHDVLYSERSDKQKLQDPVIEAIASWFVHQMFMLDNIAKAAIIHLVIENASDHYHQVAKSILVEHVNEEYFTAHEVDCEHAQMGIDMLKGESEQAYRRLVPIIDKAWDMIAAMMNRVADLTANA